jgi:cystathionine beta-synthase
MGAGELPPEPTSSDSGFTVMPSESMSSLFGTPPKASPGQGDDPMSDFPGIDTQSGPPSVHQSPVPFHSNVASVANDGPTFSDTSPTRPDQPTPLMDSSSISKSPLRDSTGSFDNPLFVEGSGAADGIENTAVRETDETDADTSVSHANPLFEDERDTTAVEDVIANIEEGVFRVDSPMTTPQLIGGTPLLDLSQYSLNPKVKIMAKCEYLNPSGSIKDRIAQHIIAQAESSGQLKPGMTVVAATSGNTGAAIAMASALRGYDYIVITNKKTSKEKIDAMKAYGGEVQVSPSGVAPDHPDHYQNIENRLVAENPGTYYGVDQYNNPYNTEAYEVTLGPEIWHQTSGEVTHFIAGGSTGGTVSGTGRYLKSQNDKVRVVMADPHGSVFWDHIVNEVPADDVKVSKSWEMEGVGKDSIPGAFDINVIDGIVRGNDEDAFAMCREVAANDGLLLGGSAGLNLHAARVLSGEVEDGAVIVTVFPDNGVKYLSKIFNDSWLESKGLQGAAEGNGAVSEDVATKPPMESTVTWKSESWNPEPPAPTAALDETHMTLETDSAPPTPIAAPTPSPEPEPPVKVANDSEGLAAELRAELDGYRVAAGEMAAEISEKDEKIASLEKELKAAAAKFKAHDSKVRAEERDRVSARLDKAEGALEKERRVAEEAKASQAQMQTRMTQMESSTAGTDALKARVETLEAAVAEAKAAETVAVEQAAALKGTVDDMEKKLAEAARSKAEAEAAKVEEPAPVQTEESADADARVAAAEKVCEKLMADNQELVTRVNAQAVELDRLRGEFKDVDIAPTLQEMNGDAAPHVEEWEQRRGRGIWGFISGADRFVPPPPNEPEEQTQNAQPEE